MPIFRSKEKRAYTLNLPQNSDVKQESRKGIFIFPTLGKRAHPQESKLRLMMG